MKATAKLRHLRMAPRKVRLVSDLIRGKNVAEAQRLLSFAAKHAALPVLKTLNSALASAKQNFQADESNLYVSRVAVTEGPKLKRFRARSQGRAYEIQKKTSHVVIELSEIKEQKARARKDITKGAVAPKPGLGTAKPGLGVPPKPSFRPEQETQRKPRKQRGIQRFFRRKAV